MKNHKRSPAVFTRKSCLVATQVALAVMAQVAYAQQATPERVERVEVTGTRLPALNVEGPSPVTVMEAQEIRMDGLAKTEDLLNNLPQVFAGQGSAVSNGSTGTANVNLRNLGPTRNLVLFNGRRLPAGSPQSGQYSAAADLNQIPAPLIQRVEILTGGASAVYGSDAITGVVNFIMNDRFEGLQIDINHSFYNHQQQNPDGIADLVRKKSLSNPTQFQVPSDVNDGRINALSMLMGRNFADNKGNATLFIGYKKEDPVLQKSRDFSACALNPGNASGTTGFSCGGSSTSFPGRFIGGLGAADPGFDLTVADAAGNTRPFNSATDQFNYGPYNYYRRPAEQYSANAFAHLDINPKVRAYTELGFHDNQTVGQVAPGGIFLGDVYTIHAENPLLSADWRNQIAAGQVAPFAGPGDTADMLIGRRNIEGGGRIQDMRHTSFRWVGGAKGALNNAWNYDVYLQTGQVQMQRVDQNYFSTVKIRRALDVITDPATGAPACRSAVSVANGGTGDDLTCVPYNLWSLGQITPGALNYISAQGLQQGTTKQHVFSASVESDLGKYGLKLPTARDGVAFAFGFERRKEALKLVTDQEEATGDLSGSGGAAIGVEGALTSDEWFTEARIPLAQRVPLADLLSINGSYRRSDYSTGKKTNTYGVGAEWAPVRAYRARASYQHAIRHANIQELFQPQGNNLFGMTSDPCGPSRSATLAQCAQTGITPAQYGSAIIDSPAGQYNYTQGGNPNLDPETANTYTLGLVMNPVRNLTASIDWWDIEIKDAIGAAPPSTLLNQCLTAGLFCDQIHRDALGTLWAINNGAVTATNLNLGSYHTAGLDLAASYTWRMGASGFGVHFNGSYMNKWEFEPIKGAGKFDCAGYFGPQCGTPNPQWRHKIRGTWQSPWNVDLALTWRHIDEVKHEAQNSSPLLNDPTVPKTDSKLDSRDYFDVAAQWNINKTLTLRAGVNNIMDTDPPIVSGVTADPAIFGNGNTFPQVYDTLGRLVFMNLTLKF